MLTVLAFVVALGLLIAVHEYGHYRMAVACGVKVLRFSVGFGKTLWRWQPANQKHGQNTEFVIGAQWPDVEIVTSYAGASRVAVDAFVAAGVRGIVVAGTGNGSIHASIQQALADAVSQGVAVVRASRVGAGHVMRNGAAPDDTLGFVAANGLNPYKSRVLLMLALAAGAAGPVVLQRAFDTY